MGPTALGDKKTYTDKTKLNPAARDIEVLRHETIGLCKKLNSIYISINTVFLPLIHRNVQLSCACS